MEFIYTEKVLDVVRHAFQMLDHDPILNFEQLLSSVIAFQEVSPILHVKRLTRQLQAMNNYFGSQLCAQQMYILREFARCIIRGLEGDDLFREVIKAIQTVKEKDFIDELDHAKKQQEIVERRRQEARDQFSSRVAAYNENLKAGRSYRVLEIMHTDFGANGKGVPTGVNRPRQAHESSPRETNPPRQRDEKTQWQQRKQNPNQNSASAAEAAKMYENSLNNAGKCNFPVDFWSNHWRQGMLGRPGSRPAAAGSDGGIDPYMPPYPEFPRRANSDSAIDGTYEFYNAQRANSDSEVPLPNYPSFPEPRKTPEYSLTSPDFPRERPYRPYDPVVEARNHHRPKHASTVEFVARVQNEMKLDGSHYGHHDPSRTARRMRPPVERRPGLHDSHPHPNRARTRKFEPSVRKVTQADYSYGNPSSSTFRRSRSDEGYYHRSSYARPESPVHFNQPSERAHSDRGTVPPYYGLQRERPYDFQNVIDQPDFLDQLDHVEFD